MTRLNAPQLAAYALVIGASTGLDVVTVWVLRDLGPLLLAVAGGFVANVGTGYVLSRRFVFLRATTPHMTASSRFCVLVALNAAVGVGAVTVMAASGVPYLVARVLSSAVLVPANFVIMRSWVFADA